MRGRRLRRLTVVLEDCDGERVRRRAINACLTTVGQSTAAASGPLKVCFTMKICIPSSRHLPPVEEPSAVSAARVCDVDLRLCRGGRSVDRSAIHDNLAGNLCRCTGYRPIVSAVVEAIGQPAGLGSEAKSRLGKQLRSAKAGPSASFMNVECEFHVPKTLNEALALRQRFEDAKILAGGTDLDLVIS